MSSVRKLEQRQQRSISSRCVIFEIQATDASRTAHGVTRQRHPPDTQI